MSWMSGLGWRVPAHAGDAAAREWRHVRAMSAQEKMWAERGDLPPQEIAPLAPQSESALSRQSGSVWMLDASGEQIRSNYLRVFVYSRR